MITNEKINEIKNELDNSNNQLLNCKHGKFIVKNGYKLPDLTFLLNDLKELLNYIKKVEEEKFSYEYYGLIRQGYIKDEIWQEFLNKCQKILNKDRLNKKKGEFIEKVGKIFIFIPGLLYFLFSNDILFGKILFFLITGVHIFLIYFFVTLKIVDNLDKSRLDIFLKSKKVRLMQESANKEIVKYIIDNNEEVFLKASTINNLLLNDNYFPRFDKEQNPFFESLIINTNNAFDIVELKRLVNSKINIINSYINCKW